MRDTGKGVLFSGQHALAEQVAVLYARKKWGPRVRRDKISLVFGMDAKMERERESSVSERPRKGRSR